MDTVANAWDSFVEPENVKKAIRNSSKDKLDLSYVQEVNRNLEYYVNEIRKMFLNGTFHMSPFKEMDKWSGNKVRHIRKSPFYPDRISQHMVANVMLKRWDKSLTNTTYASWKKRGINSKVKDYNFNHKLRSEIDSYPLSVELYALNLDFLHCYDSVDADVMMYVVRKFLRNEKLIAVIEEFVRSTKGIPLGSYLSQLLINILLELLNRFCLEVLHVTPFRYMDNIVIVGTDKHELHQIQWRIMQFVWYELHMEINRHRQVFPIGRNRDERGIDVVGYVYYRTFTLIRKSIKVAAIRKRNQPKSMSSYFGLMKKCDAINLMKSINRRIRKDRERKTAEENMQKLKDIQHIRKVERPFGGKKIKIEKIVDKEIIVIDCGIFNSVKRPGTTYVKLQIVFKRKKRFLSGNYKLLKRVIRQIDRKNDLPFETIIRYNRGYYFDGTLKEDDEYIYNPSDEVEFDLEDGNHLNPKQRKTLPFYDDTIVSETEDEETDEIEE